MSKKRLTYIDDLRGASRLVIEATRSVTAVVEAMHRTIGSGPALLGQPLAAPTALATRIVYGSIRGVTQLVGAGIDGALARLAPLLGEVLGERDSLEREAVVSVVNGVLGDYLHETGNPLAIEMRLLHAGRPLELERAALAEALPGATGKLLVLLHGSCMNPWMWRRNAHDHGEALARDLGYTPIHVHYNSGLHVSTNGRQLAAQLEQLVAAWPLPLAELAVLGHSMGGLVARAACHIGEAEGHAWRAYLGKLICLGTPHHGAPLERLGNWLEPLLGVSRYSVPLARLGRLRSAGVTDLRFGSVLDEHWDGHDRFASHDDPRDQLSLPTGVACYTIAGTLSAAAGTSLRSDGIVPVDSALGRHERDALALAFTDAQQCIAYGTGHLDLLDRNEVYAQIRAWLAG